MFSSSDAQPRLEPAEGGVWIRVAEPVRLRDYFLRLGARASIVEDVGDTLVLIEWDDEDMDAYLDSWAAINQTPVSAVEKPPKSAPGLA